MAKWSEVKRHLRNNYKISDQNQDCLKLVFETHDERTQVVFVEKISSLKGDDWIKISSPIGLIDPDDLFNATDNEYCADNINSEELEIGFFGEMIKEEDIYWFRYAMPIEYLIYEDIDTVLGGIFNTADAFEEHFIGGDEH